MYDKEIMIIIRIVVSLIFTAIVVFISLFIIAPIMSGFSGSGSGSDIVLYCFIGLTFTVIFCTLTILNRLKKLEETYKHE